MSATHTPGPWHVVNHSGMICVAADSDHPHKTLAAIGHDERAVNAWRVEEGLYPDNIANARLIAAAPELLAALQGMARIIDVESRRAAPVGAYKTLNAIDAARAAIARAERMDQ